MLIILTIKQFKVYNNNNKEMLIPLHDLVRKYNVHFKGILHVGAHECEELNDYERYLPRNKILWDSCCLNKSILFIDCAVGCLVARI